jgi:UDP-2,4-diacetamido-2,4,6-trideoxy-beta-L-altropyranose hydrolase
MTMPLFIRADASAEIGTGHVMRCLALAEAWQELGGRAILGSRCEGEALRTQIAERGIELVPYGTDNDLTADLRKTLALLAQWSAACLVLDGYQFDPTYQKAVRDTGHRLLLVDDLAHWPEYHADILLNQNINAEGLCYRCSSDTLRLLGTRYALLRHEFWRWRGGPKEIESVARRILVTVGGSDPGNVSRTVLEALATLPVDDLEVLLVVGPGNPHHESLRSYLSTSPLPVRIETNTRRMVEPMAWADFAVSGAGSTCWELAFMAVPSLLLVVADNQAETARCLAERGACLTLDCRRGADVTQIAMTLRASLKDHEHRTHLSRTARGLVDGLGARRVVAEVIALGRTAG